VPLADPRQANRECKNRRKIRTKGFRDQNAGPGAGWLVAAGASKKIKDFINCLPDEALLSPNVNDISSIYHIELKSTKICEQIVKIACIFNACRQI
jgi:hypothetical protein